MEEYRKGREIDGMLGKRRGIASVKQLGKDRESQLGRAVSVMMVVRDPL
jgi:hypothetical protein